MMHITEFYHDDVLAYFNAMNALVDFRKTSDFTLGRIEERILSYFQACDCNGLFKNKMIIMFLSLPYEMQKEIWDMARGEHDESKIIEDSKVLKLHRK